MLVRGALDQSQPIAPESGWPSLVWPEFEGGSGGNLIGLAGTETGLVR